MFGIGIIKFVYNVPINGCSIMLEYVCLLVINAAPSTKPQGSALLATKATPSPQVPASSQLSSTSTLPTKDAGFGIGPTKYASTAPTDSSSMAKEDVWPSLTNAPPTTRTMVTA